MHCTHTLYTRWAYGIIIYEMTVGYSPFKSPNVKALYEAILHKPVVYPKLPPQWEGESPPPFPEGAKAMVAELLVRDPLQRLGGSDDGSAFSQHCYFAGTIDKYTALIHCTHTLYSYTALTHCTHTLHSLYTILRR
jgi:serine/threonine protein kinase